MATTLPARHVRAVPGGVAAVARRVPAVVGVAMVLGSVVWFVLAAAERPSTLSPPTIRMPATWLLGPLHGLLPHLTTGVARLHSDMVVVFIVAGVGWALAWATAPALRAGVLLAASAGAQTVLVLGPPLPLTDVFNYEVYGRMAALHGLNPYRALPIAAAQDPVFGLANWHHLSSPYGPLFTLLSEALVPFGAHGWLWAWKAVVLVTGVATVALVGDLARRLGGSPQRAIVGFGLCPLLLLAEIGGLHNDVPAVLCVVAAVWCLVRGREAGAPWWVDVAAGVLAVTAAGIKPSFAIVLGVVVLGARDRRLALLGAAVSAVIVGLVMLVAYGGALPDLKTQGTLVTPLSIPNLLGLAAGHGGADGLVRAVARDVVIACAAVATAAVAVRRRWALTAICALLLVALFALPWVMPWYLLWALPFIVVRRSKTLALVTLVATGWLVVGSLPQLPGILHSFGYFPTRLATGLANHREFVRLVQ